MSISPVSIKIHVLVLLHIEILILSQLNSNAVAVTETEKARESDEVHFIMLAFSCLINNVNNTGGVSLMMIRSIKLTDNLIVPMLPKL